MSHTPDHVWSSFGAPWLNNDATQRASAEERSSISPRFRFAQMQRAKQKYRHSDDQAHLETCAHARYVNAFKASHTSTLKKTIGKKIGFY